MRIGKANLAGDHPRLCGEKHLLYADWSRDLGSPPPVRGKEVFSTHPVASSGITPACAGKRISREITPISSEDHPRLCGEKTMNLMYVDVP